MSTDSSMPLVSLVMPAYNYSRYVEEAVRSAWDQDYPNLELVAVDDGSTDRTLEILENLRSKSPFPMEVLRGQHKGVSAALNLAMDHVSGEYVSILHADDFFRPEKISKQIAAIRDRPDVVLVHSEYVSVDEFGKPIGHDSSVDLPPATGDALRSLLLLEADVRSMTILARRSGFQKMGRYDESLLTEDWQSILRLSTQGRIVHVREPLVFRRVHGTNLSFSMHKKQRTFSFREIAIDILREVTPSDLSLEYVCALHSGVVIRNAIAQGSFTKARHGLRECWKAFPGQHAFLARETLRGTNSFVWMNGVSRVLPTRAVVALRGLKAKAQGTAWT